ncbi:MAG: outer membrane protein [Flavobacteriales bacterium]
MTKPLLALLLTLFSAQYAFSQTDTKANDSSEKPSSVLIDLSVGGPPTTFLLTQFASFGDNSFTSSPVYEGRLSFIVKDIDDLSSDDSSNYLVLGLGVNYYRISYDYWEFNSSINSRLLETSVLNRLNVGIQGAYNIRFNDKLRVYVGAGIFYGVVNGSDTDEEIKSFMSENFWPGMPFSFGYQEFVGGAIDINKNLAIRAEIQVPGTSVLSAGFQLKF